MISFLKTRIAASLFTLGAVLQPHPCQAATIAPGAEAKLEHISITKLGKGSPVILIPGLSTPRDVYAAIAPEIARSHSVYLVQLNGFGGSAPSGNLQGGIITGVVADLDAFIARNKLKGAAVIGHSLGGLIGLELGRLHPTDVGKLMVVDTLPYVGDIFLPDAAVAMVQPQAKMMRDKAVASYGKPADPAMATATANGLALKAESRSKVAEWVKTADSRVAGQAMYEDMTTDLRPAMASIATPITLVYPWSEQMPKAKADAFYHAEYAKAPHVSFVPVGDSAHFVMLDQPEAFQAAVTAFLAN